MKAVKAQEQQYTFEEYCDFEEKSAIKYEFRNGKIMIMSGGTTDHATIIGNLYLYLRLGLKLLPNKCYALNSENKIFIKAINEGFYPDGGIVIGQRDFYKKDKAITNPAVIFEVLSDSTGNYDRGDKFRKYKLLPSFQEYILIEQDQPVIDVLSKNKNGKWEMETFIGLDDVLKLNTIDISIKLSDLYEDVENLHLPQTKIDLD